MYEFSSLIINYYIIKIQVHFMHIKINSRDALCHFSPAHTAFNWTDNVAKEPGFGCQV